jgi:hypothetical protein
MQQKQEDWYGRWVYEMVRIAKPGVPIIIEQVSSTPCMAGFDYWGGVSKDYWKKHAETNTYNWNVDPESIEIMDNVIFQARYDVFMLKKMQL